MLPKTSILLTMGATRRELFLNDLVKEAQFLIWKKTGMHHPNSDDTLLQLMKIINRPFFHVWSPNTTLGITQKEIIQKVHDSVLIVITDL